MEDLEPIFSETPERNTFAISLAAAAVIVAGAAFLILDHAAPTIAASGSNTSAANALPTPAPAGAARDSRPGSPSTVHRCNVNGAIVYSDTPCKSAKP